MDEVRAYSAEPGVWHAITDTEGIIRWAIKGQRKYRASVPRAAVDHPHLRLVRLRSQREVEEDGGLLNATSAIKIGAHDEQPSM